MIGCEPPAVKCECEFLIEINEVSIYLLVDLCI